MRYAFLTKRIGIGPISNNNVRLSRFLITKGHSIDILGRGVRKDISDLIPSGARIINLEEFRNRNALFRLIEYLKKEKPNVMLASGFNQHILACLARNISGFPDRLILRNHTQTSVHIKQLSMIDRIIATKVMKYIIRSADYITAVSRGAAVDLENLFALPSGSVRVMYNPAIDEEILERAREPVDHPWFLDRSTPILMTAARLAPEKALHILLRGFAMLRHQREARLLVLGRGPLRRELETLAGSLRISGHVDFVGYVGNPHAYMAKADLFVLSSAYEGLGNVLIEALACGCPVVATDAPSGPREILLDGKYGRLVPVGDAQALATAMSEALDESPDRDVLRKGAKRFHVDTIIEEIGDMLGLTDEKDCPEAL